MADKAVTEDNGFLGHKKVRTVPGWCMQAPWHHAPAPCTEGFDGNLAFAALDLQAPAELAYVCRAVVQVRYPAESWKTSVHCGEEEMLSEVSQGAES